MQVWDGKPGIQKSKGIDARFYLQIAVDYSDYIDRNTASATVTIMRCSDGLYYNVEDGVFQEASVENKAVDNKPYFSIMLWDPDFVAGKYGVVFTVTDSKMNRIVQPDAFFCKGER